jgi:lipopolysaccharide export system permease protein
MVVDFFEKIDDFLEAGIPASRTLAFFVLSGPFVIAQVTPVAVLLAVLIVLGLMARNNELVVLQSSGVSTRYLLLPLFGLGLACSLALFFLGEVGLPVTMARANQIWNVEVRKQIASFRQQNIWIKGHRAIYHVAYFNPVDETISGVSFNFFDEQFNVAKRIDAHKGIYRDGEWILRDCLEQIRLKDGTHQVTYPSELTLKIDLAPENLKTVVKKSEEMSFSELSTYIQRVEDEGYDATPYKVDWQAKVAFPLVCLVMAIVGTAIGLRKKRGEGIAASIAYGTGVAFCYWVVHSFCISLGRAGTLSPILAAWLTNILFISIALATLLYHD